MTYDKNISELIVSCDECSEDGSFQADSFSEAIAEAKSDGWIVRRLPANEWAHFCSKECEARYDFKK